MIDRETTDFFQAGGTLLPDAPSYVKRSADDDLLQFAQKGTFCYVLTSRQMGKSSLMSRTADQLKKQKISPAIIDLTKIGTVTVDQWYLGLLTELEWRLRLSTEPIAWWQARASLSPAQRFTNFLRHVVLKERTERIVIFIDEIDTTLNLEFRDDFFAAIRAMYNARAHDPEFKRLTFVLLGVASPTELIKDNARTPFNIGKGIALSEFSQADAAVLRKGLETVFPRRGEGIFGHIYYWTSGHPYLTQRLCLSIASSKETDWSHQQIDALVQKLFLSEAASGKESNLQFVQKRILSSGQKPQLLRLYQKIHKSTQILDDVQSIIQNELKLAGLVKVENGYLQVRNQIYRHVFDLAWVRKNSQTTSFFVAGGTLPPDSPSYVKRSADDELLRLVQQGIFCYVLTPRQMGKSSLMSQTADELNAQGVSTAIIDLTRIGTTTVDQWYLGLLRQLRTDLHLTEDPNVWSQALTEQGVSAVQRFTDFLRQVVLTEIEGQVVIFIDEIDSTLNLAFTDDFFAAIRAMYNARANDAQFNRLTFVLLGVASPLDLIKDRQRTPFNIGRGIALSEFSLADGIVLQQGLETLFAGQAEAIFGRIYQWTSGHPYLTQHLCLNMAESGDRSWSPQKIDELVEKLFFSEAAGTDSNLQFVQNKVLDSPQRRQLLNLYKQVHQGQQVADDGQSIIHNQLKLAGLLKAEGGYLHVRNHIYRHVFDLAWVKKNTQINWTRLVAGVAIAVALLAVGLIAQNAWIGIQAQSATNRFYEAPNPAEQVAPLAKLFRLQGFVPPTVYDYKARELFISLSSSQQVALFEVDHVDHSDLITVIEGLYITLADVDNTDSTRPLLNAMVEALNQLDQTEETTTLRDEINYWLEARALSSQNKNNEALSQYDQALALNGENPATLYERAQVLTKLERYPQALDDFDRIVAIANTTSANQPTPLPSPTPQPTMTPHSTPSPLLVDVKFTATINPTTSVELTPSPPSTTSVPTSTEKSATIDAILVPTIIPTAIPLPTPTPTPASIGSNFDTPGKMIGEVRKSIQRVPQLTDALVNAPLSEKTNLRDVVPPPTATPTPTLTPTVSSTPLPSPSAIALAPSTLATTASSSTIVPSATRPASAPVTSSPASTATTQASSTANPSQSPTISPTGSPNATLVTSTPLPASPSVQATLSASATLVTSTPIPTSTPFVPSVTTVTTVPPSATPLPSPLPPSTTPQPSATPPPTATALQPSTTRIVPSATPIPASATPIPATNTPIPASATPIPASATPIPASATPLPPANTPLPPPNTPISPSATPIPPSATPVAPTNTSIPPSATPIPTPTATLVPPTFTPSPTARAYARPVLLSPADNVTISQPTTLQWSWDGTLQANEHFDVRVWQEGQPRQGITWTKDRSYQFDPRSKANGNYFWSIVVIRGQNGQWEADLSQAAAERRLNISGGSGGSSSGGGSSPTQPPLPTPPLLP